MILRTVALALSPAVLLLGFAQASTADEPAGGATVLSYKAKDIDGKPVDLAKFKGEVLLIVNTASKCGNTPQYKGLESLYEKYKGQGFEVLAFPANEFGKQEPGSNSDIKAFCTSTYDVSFPLFSKTVVKGEGIDPLFKYLTSKETNPKFGGEIGWNFAKFLINRKGEVVGRFAPGEDPESSKVVKAIEAELAAPK